MSAAIASIKNNTLGKSKLKMFLLVMVGSSAVLGRIVIVFSILGFACFLLGEFVLDEANYIRLLQCNIFTIYASVFLAALPQCKKNPSSKKRSRKLWNKLYDNLRKNPAACGRRLHDMGRL